MNALRFATAYTLDPTRFAALRDVADALGLGEHERYELDMGYVLALPDPAPATRLFGGVVSEAEEAGVTSVSDPADLIRITTAVTQARTSADLVIVYLHTQEYEQDVSRPAAFTRAFAKACVDAGAHVVAASGPHVVRGVERYDGAPILHGLGNLWFQYDQLERLPPDSLTAYGLPPTATPGDFSRTAMLGFRRDHRYWESAVARCNFEGGRLRQLTLHPVTSGYGQAVDRRGAPEIAGPDDAARILTEIADLSAELGAHVRVHDGLGHLALDDR